MRPRTVEYSKPPRDRHPYPLALLAGKAVLVFAGLVLTVIAGVGSLALWRSGHPPVAASDTFVIVALGVVGPSLLTLGCTLGRSRASPPAA